MIIQHFQIKYGGEREGITEEERKEGKAVENRLLHAGHFSSNNTKHMKDTLLLIVSIEPPVRLFLQLRNGILISIKKWCMENVLFDLGWNSSGETLKDSPSDCYLLNKKWLKKILIFYYQQINQWAFLWTFKSRVFFFPVPNLQQMADASSCLNRLLKYHFSLETHFLIQLKCRNQILIWNFQKKKEKEKKIKKSNRLLTKGIPWIFHE